MVARMTTNTATEPQSTSADQALDRALARLRSTGPDYFGVLANHGPMVVEALHHAGRSEAIEPWLDRYIVMLEPAAPPVGTDVPPNPGDTYETTAAWFEQELSRRH